MWSPQRCAGGFRVISLWLPIRGHRGWLGYPMDFSGKNRGQKGRFHQKTPWKTMRKAWENHGYRGGFLLWSPRKSEEKAKPGSILKDLCWTFGGLEPAKKSRPWIWTMICLLDLFFYVFLKICSCGMIFEFRLMVTIVGCRLPARWINPRLGILLECGAHLTGWNPKPAPSCCSLKWRHEDLGSLGHFFQTAEFSSMLMESDGSLGPEPVCFVGSWSESSRWVGSQFWMHFPWMGQPRLKFPSLTTQLAIIWINRHHKPWLFVCWGYPQTSKMWWLAVKLGKIGSNPCFLCALLLRPNLEGAPLHQVIKAAKIH